MICDPPNDSGDEPQAAQAFTGSYDESKDAPIGGSIAMLYGGVPLELQFAYEVIVLDANLTDFALLQERQHLQ